MFFTDHVVGETMSDQRNVYGKLLKNSERSQTSFANCAKLILPSFLAKEKFSGF